MQNIDDTTTATTDPPVKVPAYDCPDYYTYHGVGDDDRLVLLNQETERALKAHTSFLLYGYKIKDYPASWTLFQIIKKIVQSSCPVQSFLTSGLLRLFKYYSIYSNVFFPKSIRFESKIQDQRVASILRLCHRSLPRIDLSFGIVQECHTYVSKTIKICTFSTINLFGLYFPSTIGQFYGLGQKLLGQHLFFV